jgi:hypothetical protein
MALKIVVFFLKEGEIFEDDDECHFLKKLFSGGNCYKL